MTEIAFLFLSGKIPKSAGGGEGGGKGSVSKDKDTAKDKDSPAAKKKRKSEKVQNTSVTAVPNACLSDIFAAITTADPFEQSVVFQSRVSLNVRFGGLSPNRAYLDWRTVYIAYTAAELTENVGMVDDHVPQSGVATKATRTQRSSGTSKSAEPGCLAWPAVRAAWVDGRYTVPTTRAACNKIYKRLEELFEVPDALDTTDMDLDD